MMYDVFLACYAGDDEPDPDRNALSLALDAANISYKWVIWDDPSVEWSNARVCYPRATWDYYKDSAAFIQWAHHVDSVSQLHNPASIIEWNIHKGYLNTLAQEGIAVVPTVVVEQGKYIELKALRRQQGWQRLVIKPAVSCGSHETYVVEPGDEHPRWFPLVEQRDMIVQPYIDAVDTSRERSCIVIDDQLTHVMIKHPRFNGEHEQVTGPVDASDAEHALVNQLRTYIGQPLDYMRVDMVMDTNGEPMLAELEVIEPSLFFDAQPLALERFVEVIRRRINS